MASPAEFGNSGDIPAMNTIVNSPSPAGPGPSSGAPVPTCARAARWVPPALAVVLTAVYATLSLRRFARLDTPSWDNAIFEQAIRGYAHLQAPIVDIKGPGFNILGDHFSPITALIAPVYRIFPAAQTLLVAQAVLVGLSIIPIGRAALRILGTRNGIAVTLAYGLSFGIQSAIYVDFHEMAFAAPLIAWAGDAYLRRRWHAVAAWLLPLLLVKEDLGITVAVAGIVVAWCGARRVGYGLIAAGLAGFALTVFVIIPAFGAGGFGYWGAVGLTGSGPGAFTNLFARWDIKIVTLVATFGITGFLALRSRWAILVIPTLGWRFIGEKTAYWGTGWHYSLVLMPIVFIALLDALPALRTGARRWLAVYTARAPAVTLVVAAALCLIFPLRTLAQADTWRPGPRATAAAQVMALLPPGASVETNRGLITHLVTDHRVFWFDTIGDVIHDFVLIDSRTSRDITDAADFAAQAHPDVDWRQIYNRDGYLLARNTSR